MEIIKNCEYKCDSNIYLYDCINDDKEKMCKIHIEYLRNLDKNEKEYDWYVWERVECNSLEDYLLVKNSIDIKLSVEHEIKSHTQCYGRVKVIIYPHSNDHRIIQAMNQYFLKLYTDTKMTNNIVEDYELQ